MSQPDIEILTRSQSGVWYTVKGIVDGVFVSVDIPKQQFEGLDEAAVEQRMKRALRAGKPYARG